MSFKQFFKTRFANVFNRLRNQSSTSDFRRFLKKDLRPRLQKDVEQHIKELGYKNFGNKSVKNDLLEHQKLYSMHNYPEQFKDARYYNYKTKRALPYALKKEIALQKSRLGEEAFRNFEQKILKEFHDKEEAFYNSYKKTQPPINITDKSISKNSDVFPSFNSTIDSFHPNFASTPIPSRLNSISASTHIPSISNSTGPYNSLENTIPSTSNSTGPYSSLENTIPPTSNSTGPYNTLENTKYSISNRVNDSNLRHSSDKSKYSDAESFLSKGNDYSKKLNSIPIESKKTTPYESFSLSEIPPLEELNNSIPPLEELNNSIPAIEKSLSPYVTDSSFNSSHIPTPQELSFNNSQMSFPQEPSLNNSNHSSINQSLVNQKLDEYFSQMLNKPLTGSVKNSPLNQSRHSSKNSSKNISNRSIPLDDIFSQANIDTANMSPFDRQYAATLKRLADEMKKSKSRRGNY